MSAEETLSKVAMVAHFGGLISFEDQLKALTEIRKLTLDYIDLVTVNKIQKELK